MMNRNIRRKRKRILFFPSNWSNLEILAVTGFVSKGEKVAERALVVEQVKIRARIHRFRLVLQRLIRRV